MHILIRLNGSFPPLSNTLLTTVSLTSTGGFLLLRIFSGYVAHPRDLQVSQLTLFHLKSSSLTHHRPYS